MTDKLKNILMLILAVIFLIAAEWNSEKREIYTAIEDDRGIQSIEMVTGSDFFKPNTLIVKVNVPVEITIRTEPGSMQHSFIMREPEAGIFVEEEITSEPKKIAFTPKTTGQFPFYCDKGLIESHRENGMEGVLEVMD